MKYILSGIIVIGVLGFMAFFYFGYQAIKPWTAIQMDSGDILVATDSIESDTTSIVIEPGTTITNSLKVNNEISPDVETEGRNYREGGLAEAGVGRPETLVEMGSGPVDFSPPPHSLTFYGDQKDFLFRLVPLGDGLWGVILGPNILWTDAAKDFWEMVRIYGVEPHVIAIGKPSIQIGGPCIAIMPLPEPNQDCSDGMKAIEIIRDYPPLFDEIDAKFHTHGRRPT